MNQDPIEKAGEAAESKPETWERDQMSSDPETSPEDADSTVPTWKEGQMAEQHADGSRSPNPSDADIAESAGGLSGGGANPGGGERWAERDEDPAKD